MKLTTSKQNKIDFENLIVAQNEFEMDLRNNSISATFSFLFAANKVRKVFRNALTPLPNEIQTEVLT